MILLFVLFFQYLILDALFALGKNENGFNWTKKPKVLRLSKEINDSCYLYLKPKRKPQTIDDVWCSFLSQGYIKFKREELLLELKNDGRFIIENETDPYCARVKTKRKKDL